MGTIITCRRIEQSDGAAPDVLLESNSGADVNICEVSLEKKELTLQLPEREDHILVRLQLSDIRAHHGVRAGRRVDFVNSPRGSVILHDLRDISQLSFGGPFSALFFLISRRALDRALRLIGREGAEILDADRVSMDPIFHSLASCMLPRLQSSGLSTDLFIQQITLALLVHIANAYLACGETDRKFQGGLAAWQIKRAKALLAADLAGHTQLPAVADACGISVSHFARSFRRSVGVTPHRWLTGQRISAAKEMLCDTSTSLAEIGLNCGFADQSHFTRTFSREVGISPGSWRRSQGAGDERAVA